MFKESRERRSEASRKKGSFCLSLFLIHYGQWRNAKKKKKTHKNWKQLSWMSQSPSSSFNIWLLFTNIKLFDSESDFLNVARASRWQTSGSKGFVLFFCFVLFFAEVELTSCACATILLNSVATAFACKSARVLPWYSGLVLLVWASILMTATAEGKRIKSENHLTFCPFLIGVPEESISTVRQGYRIKPN